MSKFSTGLRRSSPTILTVLGIVGVVGTAVMAVRATPKAMKLIKAKKDKLETDKLTPVELVKTTLEDGLECITIDAMALRKFD